MVGGDDGTGLVDLPGVALPSLSKRWGEVRRVGEEEGGGTGIGL